MRLFPHIHFLVCIILFVGGIYSHTYPIRSFFTKNPVCYRCNVVLIVIDTLRADELPCYGYERNTASNLCQLIDKSVMFTHAFSQSSWTLPSNISYFTSQYPNQHKVLISGQDVIDASTTTLPQAFKKAGYQTIYAGPDHPNSPLDKGMGRGFDLILPNLPLDKWSETINLLNQNNAVNTPTFLYLHAYDLTGSWADTAVTSKPSRFDPTAINPFSVTTAPYDTNMWEATNEFLLHYDGERTNDINTLTQQLKEAKNVQASQQYFEKLPKHIQEKIKIFSLAHLFDMSNPAHIRYVRNLYDEKLYDIDRTLAPVVHAVQSSNLNTNTIVVFTSDHGEEFGEHQGFHHGKNLYAATTQVPLSIYIPHLKPQKRTDLIQGIDIFPTLMSAVGLTIPKTTYGLNMMPRIMNLWFARKNFFVITELFRGTTESHVGLQTEKWSYYRVTHPDKPYTEELYNTQKDPKEQRDVSKIEPNVNFIMRHALDAIRMNDYSQKNVLPAP